MLKYYQIQVRFNKSDRWETLDDKYQLMHVALNEMIRIDLSFPTRIVRTIKEVVLTDEQRRKRGKSKYSKNKAHTKRVARTGKQLKGNE